MFAHSFTYQLHVRRLSLNIDETKIVARASFNSINLIHVRNVGVNPTNPFVFAVSRNGSLKNVRGPDAVRKHVNLCNLKFPEAIYSTNLRKHVATAA